MPSYFGILTILAFHIFLQEKVHCQKQPKNVYMEFIPDTLCMHVSALQAVVQLTLDFKSFFRNEPFWMCIRKACV